MAAAKVAADSFQEEYGSVSESVEDSDEDSSYEAQSGDGVAAE
jgi:hypothetical protein